MNHDVLEQQSLDRIADNYRNQGYDVTIHPNEGELPEFLAGYMPDLVARRSGESVVVELKIGTRTSAAERFREIAERINQQPGWRFSLVFVNPERPELTRESNLPAPSKLREWVAGAEELSRAGNSEAAFMVLWSAAEGALRILSRRAAIASENLPPSALIRELYSAGELSMEHFNSLLELIPTRNQLAHGFDSGSVAPQVEQLRTIVHELLSEVSTP